MRINCIIVEDEPLALKRTQAYVSKISFLNLQGCFDNGFKALDFLRKGGTDLIFLDIKMDELTGIQLLESLDKKPHVIITSAYNEYAIKGYELNVTDYLLKPFSIERFIQAIEKVNLAIHKKSQEDRNFFFVKSDYKIEKLLFDEIYLIEGMGDYRAIHTKTRRVLTSQTFIELESELPPNKFCRVHKSFIISIDKIERIERNQIRLLETFVPISETYKDNFYKLIGFDTEGKVKR